VYTGFLSEVLTAFQQEEGVGKKGSRDRCSRNFGPNVTSKRRSFAMGPKMQYVMNTVAIMTWSRFHTGPVHDTNAIAK
jgi:hypothetical protein